MSEIGAVGILSPGEMGSELLVAARLLGVEDQLRAEQSQGGDLEAVRRFVERALPSMPPKAYRWIGEKEEIARCFEDLGMPGRLLLGAADVYTKLPRWRRARPRTIAQFASPQPEVRVKR